MIVSSLLFFTPNLWGQAEIQYNMDDEIASMSDIGEDKRIHETEEERHIGWDAGHQRQEVCISAEC